MRMSSTSQKYTASLKAMLKRLGLTQSTSKQDPTPPSMMTSIPSSDTSSLSIEEPNAPSLSDDPTDQELKINLAEYVATMNLSSILNRVVQEVYEVDGLKLITLQQLTNGYMQYLVSDEGVVQRDTFIQYQSIGSDIRITGRSGSVRWELSLDNFYTNNKLEVELNKQVAIKIATAFVEMLVKDKKISAFTILPGDATRQLRRVEGFSVSESHACVEFLFADKTSSRNIVPKEAIPMLSIGDYLSTNDQGVTVYDCKHIN